MCPIAAGDSRPDLIATTAIHELLKAKPYCLGTTRNDPSLNKLVNGICEFVPDPRHKLYHAHSIPKCNAHCHARHRCLAPVSGPILGARCEGDNDEYR